MNAPFDMTGTTTTGRGIVRNFVGDRQREPPEVSPGRHGARRAGARRWTAEIRACRGSAQVRRRWHAAWLGRQPAGLRRDRRGRHRQHRLPSLRDGSGNTHRHADHRRRRARSRLGARACGAGHRRRRALRQPGYRRLAQHAPLLHADASLRRCGAPDAGSSGRRTLEGSGQRSSGEEQRGRAYTDRPASRLRRARQGGGNHAAPRAGCDQAQGSLAVSLHRHGQAEASRRPGHRDRQGAVRHGHAPARHALRRGRATAGLRRQGRERRRCRGAQNPGRGADRENRSLAGSAAVQPPRRRRGNRAQHVGGDARAQRVEDRLGRRPERELRLGCVQDDARGGRAQAGSGRSQRGGLRGGGRGGREAHHGRILSARISRMRRWSLRRRALASRKANAKSGAASSHRKPHAISSPSGWACRSRMSRCT